jgi:hypothetical protein
MNWTVYEGNSKTVLKSKIERDVWGFEWDGWLERLLLSLPGATAVPATEWVSTGTLASISGNTRLFKMMKGTDPSTSRKKRRKPTKKDPKAPKPAPEPWEVNFEAAKDAEAKIQVLLLGTRNSLIIFLFLRDHLRQALRTKTLIYLIHYDYGLFLWPRASPGHS